MIELACGEYGRDKIETLVKGSENGKSIKWLSNPELLFKRSKGIFLNLLLQSYVNFILKRNFKITAKMMRKNCKHAEQSHQPTSQWNQITVLIKRGIIKTKRDSVSTFKTLILILTHFFSNSRTMILIFTDFNALANLGEYNRRINVRWTFLYERQ